MDVELARLNLHRKVFKEKGQGRVGGGEGGSKKKRWGGGKIVGVGFFLERRAEG